MGNRPRISVKKKLGNCFASAYKSAEKFSKEGWQVFIVHGTVVGAKGSDIEGIEYVHGWVELAFGTRLGLRPEEDGHTESGLMCFDSEANCLVPAITYYQTGQVKAVARYTFPDAIFAIHNHGHFGPWTKDYLGINEKIIEGYLSKKK